MGEDAASARIVDLATFVVQHKDALTRYTQSRFFGGSSSAELKIKLLHEMESLVEAYNITCEQQVQFRRGKEQKKKIDDALAAERIQAPLRESLAQLESALQATDKVISEGMQRALITFDEGIQVAQASVRRLSTAKTALYNIEKKLSQQRFTALLNDFFDDEQSARSIIAREASESFVTTASNIVQSWKSLCLAHVAARKKYIEEMLVEEQRLRTALGETRNQNTVELAAFSVTQKVQQAEYEELADEWYRSRRLSKRMSTEARSSSHPPSQTHNPFSMVLNSRRKTHDRVISNEEKDETEQQRADFDQYMLEVGEDVRREELLCERLLRQRRFVYSLLRGVSPDKFAIVAPRIKSILMRQPSDEQAGDDSS